MASKGVRLNRTVCLPLAKRTSARLPGKRRMIERLRLQHYSWRTEQTYRDWARRFAKYTGSEDLSGATDQHIKGFLSDLAVKGRVSAATQKQAFSVVER